MAVVQVGDASRPAVVRIRDASGAVVGAGFMVDKDIVCSCAHVTRPRPVRITSGTVERSTGGMKEYRSYLTYTPDGKRLAILGSDHKLRFWDADRGTRVGRAIALGNESLPSTVGFDQGRAVTEEQAGDALRFWDLKEGELVAELHSTLMGRGDAVMSDGRIPVAGEGWYLALDLRGSEMAEQLCRAVARDFTEAEKELLPQGVPEEAPCSEDS